MKEGMHLVCLIYITILPVESDQEYESRCSLISEFYFT